MADEAIAKLTEWSSAREGRSWRIQCFRDANEVAVLLEWEPRCMVAVTVKDGLDKAVAKALEDFVEVSSPEYW